MLQRNRTCQSILWPYKCPDENHSTNQARCGSTRSGCLRRMPSSPGGSARAISRPALGSPWPVQFLCKGRRERLFPKSAATCLMESRLTVPVSPKHSHTPACPVSALPTWLFWPSSPQAASGAARPGGMPDGSGLSRIASSRVLPGTCHRTSGR